MSSRSASRLWQIVYRVETDHEWKHPQSQYLNTLFCTKDTLFCGIPWGLDASVRDGITSTARLCLVQSTRCPDHLQYLKDWVVLLLLLHEKPSDRICWKLSSKADSFVGNSRTSQSPSLDCQEVWTRRGPQNALRWNIIGRCTPPRAPSVFEPANTTTVATNTPMPGHWEPPPSHRFFHDSRPVTTCNPLQGARLSLCAQWGQSVWWNKTKPSLLSNLARCPWNLVQDTSNLRLVT